MAEILKQERLCFVVASRHPLANKTVSLKDLRKFSFVLGAKTGGYTGMIERLLEREGLVGFGVALRVGSFEVIKETVRSGLGIGVLPEFIVQREIKNGVLAEIIARQITLIAKIILVERLKYTPTPTVVAVKAFIETRLRP